MVRVTFCLTFEMRICLTSLPTLQCYNLNEIGVFSRDITQTLLCNILQFYMAVKMTIYVLKQNKKIMYTLVDPSFTIYKLGVRGYTLHGHVSMMT